MATPILLSALDPSSGQWTEYANQSFSLTANDGSQVMITLEEIQTWKYYSGLAYIIYGTAIGLCSALLVVMVALALIDQTKLRRPIFVLNMANLFLASSRAIIFGISSPFLGFAQKFLGYPVSDGDIFEGLVIISVIVELFLYASIIATLGLQVRVILSATKKKCWQLFITIMVSVAGLVLFIFEFAYCVYFIIFVIAQEPVPVWVITTVRVLFIVFVGTCSLVFLYKLGIAIRQRRRIGISKFGPLQILFIMSCQCLIAPLIFYVLSDTVIPFPNMVVIGQAVLVCSLPLSSLWASSAETIEHSSPPSAVLNVRGDFHTPKKDIFLHESH